MKIANKHTSKNPRIHFITPHRARTRAVFGERHRFSPLVPKAIGRVLVRVRVPRAFVLFEFPLPLALGKARSLVRPYSELHVLSMAICMLFVALGQLNTLPLKSSKLMGYDTFSTHVRTRARGNPMRSYFCQKRVS